MCLPVTTGNESVQQKRVMQELCYNMNIYRGCPHGCIYCDSRSDCFQDADFGTVKVKENALQIIRDDLRRKVKTGVVGNGSMSDPYNSLEAELKLTRNSLELINAFGFGACVTTKSSLVARDADILGEIQEHSPVLVMFSVTTADDELCKKLEPGVCLAFERFEAMSKLAESGVFCGVLLNPMLPYITDTEENVRGILRMAKEAGAKFVYTYMGMTLRPGSREYYYRHLDGIMPGVKEKYMKKFGYKKDSSAPDAKELWGVYKTECERLRLLSEMRAIIRGYKAGYGDRQMRLF